MRYLWHTGATFLINLFLDESIVSLLYYVQLKFNSLRSEDGRAWPWQRDVLEADELFDVELKLWNYRHIGW